MLTVLALYFLGPTIVLFNIELTVPVAVESFSFPPSLIPSSMYLPLEASKPSLVWTILSTDHPQDPPASKLNLSLVAT
jgi:hypothetical protein